ncbi:hypothetical protein [Agromyces sp. ZXT2-6]|uniref:hypothetical protein n=1 Tax=Agromyces sp. ZXT2-6 TaxID=3461153 RepID=UPI004054FB96
MERPRGSAGARRGRHAAPPEGPRGPVERVAAVALAVLALGRERVWAPLTARVAPARDRAGTALAAFRAGPVVPWLSAHRMPVLIGGALLVSAIALGGAAAMIASSTSVAGVDDEAAEVGDRPGPGSGYTMPTPAPSSPVPTPTSTPTPTPTPTPAPVAPGATDPSIDPEPTTVPAEPTTEPEDDAPGNSGDSPGAANRPDKDKD